MAIPLVAGHGDETMNAGKTQFSEADASSTTPSYFTYPDYRGNIYFHIVLMSIAWVILMPIGALG